MAKKIPFVIAYDFDGTLAPGNMQEYDFIPALNIKISEFWKEVGKAAQENDADQILTYMHLMLEKAREKKISVKKEDFSNFGKKLSFFSGVEEWFPRINKYGKTRGVEVEHYIISSGLREMIEGTSIHKHFKKIYASSFVYDHNGAPCWPALAVNYTTKTQFLFRINKGSLDVYDNTTINKFIPHEERPVPFSNMVFIGDGETDIPSMRLVKDQGGHSIAVYPTKIKGAKDKATQLVKEGRANLALIADYQENSVIDQAMKAMIDLVLTRENIRKCK